MPPPVSLRVVARVHLLDCNARTGRCWRRRELQLCRATFGATAVQRHTAVVGVIEIAGAGALVGIGHRTAARQTPRAGQRDRAVDAARTGRGGHHQTAPGPIEMIRHLQQHPMRRSRTGNARECLIFAPRHVGHATVDSAVAAQRPEIGDAFPVGLDRPPAQFLRARLQRVGKRQWRIGQTGQPKTGAQQVIVAAMFADAHFTVVDITHCGFLRHGIIGTRRQQQTCQHRQDQ